MKTRTSQDDFEKIYALTPLQEGILFHSLRGDADQAYVVHVRIDLRGELDPAKFRRCVACLIERHEALRTEFYTGAGEQPMQLVLKQRTSEVSHHVLVGWPDHEQEQAIAEHIERDRRRGFALQDEILFRAAVFERGASRHAVVFAFHHIILDGWSLGLLYKELLADYRTLAEGRALAFAPGKPFGRYLTWLRGRDRASARAFWQDYLSGYGELASVVTGQRPAGRAYRAAEKQYSFAPALTALLASLCPHYGVTPGMFFQCVWGVLLAKFSGADDVVFGAVVSGRPAEVPQVEEIVGLFANTLPVRLRAAGMDRFSAVLQDSQREFWASQVHGYLSLAEIQSCTRSREFLLDHLFVFENFHLDAGLKSGAASQEACLAIEAMKSYEQTNYPLTVVIAPGDPYKVKFLYDAEAVSETQLDRLAWCFGQIAVDVAAHPDLPLADLRLVDDDEWRRQRAVGSGPSLRTEGPNTLHGLLEQRVRYADGPAIMCGGQWHTCGELNALANRLARRLREHCGVRAGDVVALMADRSFEMLVGIFGILKSGAAYLPIDVHAPAERLGYMLEDSACVAALAQGSEFAQRLAAGSGMAVLDLATVRNLPEADADLSPACTGSDLAYALYTSGSTGRPKCVVLEHASVLNTLAHLQVYYPISPADAYLFKTSYTFDVSVPEIFGWLAGGGRLVVLPVGEEGDPAAIVARSRTHGVTHVNFVPSMLHPMMDYLGEDSAGRWPGWRYVMVAGEAFPAETARLAGAWGKLGCLANLYGPTEAAVYATDYDLADWPGGGSVPIGRAFSNLRVFALDAEGAPRPGGTLGELCLAGPQLARGYLNRPELTHERFVLSSWVGERIYRTGDLVRVAETGLIEYRGRRDGQVKIRGHRIELGEIEAVAESLPGVRRAAVKVWAMGEEDALCLYVVGEGEVDPAALRRALGERLPAYMVPAYVLPLATMPLTPSGKANRSQLPRPEVGGAAAAGREPPASYAECRMAEIWRRVLGLAEIGVCDEFFQLGGHSLNALRICSQIVRDLEREVSVADLFRRPTIRALTALLEQRSRAECGRVHRADPAAVYPPSAAQCQIHGVQERYPASTIYNMPVALEFRGEFDGERLRAALASIVARHEALRTRFVRQGAELMQQIDAGAAVPLVVMVDAESPLEALAADFLQPFALDQAPLLRARLVARGPGCHWLLCDLHHIIADAESLNVIVHDLVAAYEGLAGAPLPLQFKDYTVWRESAAGRSAVTRHRDYWLEQFPGGFPRFALPHDFDDASRPHDRWGGSSLRLSCADLSQRVLTFCREQAVTPHMFVLAAYAMLLSSRAGVADLVVGVPASGRTSSDLDGVVGMFVTLLPLRLQPVGEKTFAAFLLEVKGAVLGALEHQEFPLEELALLRGLETAQGLSEVTAAVCEFNEVPLELPRLPGVQVRSLKFRPDTVKFDLKLTGRIRGGLDLEIEYRTACFAAGTIEDWARQLDGIVRRAVAAPNRTLADLKQHEADGAALAAFNETLA